ncbi:hypothetical protein [Streptosporangium canum]|uniref:hypothetical protein n=1 Tax=Streptosporangium canum TaxID=324952 RepID=UPI0033BB8A04
MNDIMDDIANLLYPDPAPQPDELRNEFVRRRAEARREREEVRDVLELRAKDFGDGFDPLTSELRRLSRAKREIEQWIRLLVTYGREFVRPEPYRLASLAEAAGMSISGVKGMYSAADIQRVADAIGRSDRKGQVSPGESPAVLPEKGLDIYGRFVPEFHPLYPPAEETESPRSPESSGLSSQS